MFPSEPLLDRGVPAQLGLGLSSETGNEPLGQLGSDPRHEEQLEQELVARRTPRWGGGEPICQLRAAVLRQGEHLAGSAALIGRLDRLDWLDQPVLRKVPEHRVDLAEALGPEVRDALFDDPLDGVARFRPAEEEAEDDLSGAIGRRRDSSKIYLTDI
jgi:hypothetical protein